MTLFFEAFADLKGRAFHFAGESYVGRAPAASRPISLRSRTRGDVTFLYLRELSWITMLKPSLVATPLLT